jgi:hypothetical protein
MYSRLDIEASGVASVNLYNYNRKQNVVAQLICSMMAIQLADVTL